MTDQCVQTPLVDLLRSVPADARLLIIEDNPYSTQYIPVGRLCHEAAALLAPSRQPCIDERERLIAGLSALIYWAQARGDPEDARRWEAIRQDLLGGKVGEWCFFVETQERAA